MAELNKNAIKLSHMFDLDINKVKKLYDIIGLSDLAALTTALNNDDMKTVKSIVSKYQSQLVDLPDAKQVQNFYYDQIQTNGRNEEQSLADTADHFGITGEQVQQMLDASKVEAVESTDMPFIPDTHVEAAFNNVLEMLKGGKTQMLLCSLNPWQKRMFYGLVPEVVSAVCQQTLDMTPIAIMQKQAELEGVAEISVQESTMSLHQMIENIIQHELNDMAIKEDAAPDEDTDTTEDDSELEIKEDANCPTCSGHGKVRQDWQYGKMLVKCPDCKGINKSPAAKPVNEQESAIESSIPDATKDLIKSITSKKF